MNKRKNEVKSKNLKSLYKNFLNEDSGSMVLELVIIIAIVLAVALIFNGQIRDFTGRLFSDAFDYSKLSQVFS